MEGITEFCCYGFRGATKRDLDIVNNCCDDDDCYLNASLDLSDRRDCDYDADADKLDGTSAIGISELMLMPELKDRYLYSLGYANNHHKTGVVLFVGGRYECDGEDYNESIISADFSDGAKVIAIVKNEEE